MRQAVKVKTIKETQRHRDTETQTGRQAGRQAGRQTRTWVTPDMRAIADAYDQNSGLYSFKLSW